MASDVPFISVVTPSFNQGAFIEETIQSVLNQNYPRFQHIVMDGGSTDQTLQILRRYSHLQWHSERDASQAQALNKAISLAQGEIIAWINSDDYYPPQTFQRVAEAFQKSPFASVIVGDCLEQKQSTQQTARLYKRELGFEDLLRYWDDRLPPHQPSVFFKSHVVRELGTFDESFRYAMDYEYWLRISQKYRFVYLPEILSVYRFHFDSKSGPGTDWTRFYPEWQRAYLRYKPASRLLPQRPMLTVAIPNADDLDLYIESLKKQRLYDLEILVVAENDPIQHSKASECPFELKIVTVPRLTPQSFQDAVSQHASGFAIHCPASPAPVPVLWYCSAVNQLLDHAELDEITDKSTRPELHPILKTLRPGTSTVVRRSKLHQFKRQISVVIPTYNRADVLQQCLQSLAIQTLPPEQFEVFVCDDGSTDETRTVVEQFSAPYRLEYIRQKNSGPAAARNQGMRRASGRYLLILNDDAVPDSHLLEAHLKAHSDSPTEKAVLGSFPIHPDQSTHPFGRLVADSKSLFQYSGMQSGSIYDWRYFWTCNISFPYSVMEKIGWFDEDFSEPAGEDIDYGYRFWKLGGRITYDPSCRAEHLHEITLPSFCRRQISVGRNLVLLAMKHPELSKSLLGETEVRSLFHKTRGWLSRNQERIGRDFVALQNPQQTQEYQQKLDQMNVYWLRQGILDGICRSASQYRETSNLRFSFVVAGLQISGGLRVILEYCNRLAQKNASVVLVSLTPERLDWFALDPRVKVIFSGWNDQRLDHDLPEAEAIFATHWSTVYPVSRTSASKGEKFYLVQSYESDTITGREHADPTYLLPLNKIVVSSFLKQRMKESFNEDAITIPNAVDARMFFPEPQHRKKYPAEHFRVGMLYHPEPRKGCADGIEAIAQARQKCPEIKLILFGSVKPDKETYDEFHGSLKGDQVRNFYNSLDAFLSTSLQEGFGLPGLEAMACGIPLITTDSGGIREYAIHEENALVCAAGRSETLADAILQLRLQPQLREKLKEQGLRTSRNFSWERSVDQLESYVGERLREPKKTVRPTQYPAATGTGSPFYYSNPASAPFVSRLVWKLRDRSHKNRIFRIPRKLLRYMLQ